MKKGNRKFLAIAALLLFVGVGIATYAIYKTSVSGTASVSTANWSVVFTANDTTTLGNNTTIDLSKLTWNNKLGKVATGKIAPGSSATFPVKIDADGSEVDVDYEITLGSIEYNAGTTDAPNWQAADASLFTVTTAGDATSGTIAYNATAGQMEKTVNVTVTWLGEVTDAGDESIATSKNGKDVALNDKPLRITVNAVAAQRLASVNHD